MYPSDLLAGPDSALAASKDLRYASMPFDKVVQSFRFLASVSERKVDYSIRIDCN